MSFKKNVGTVMFFLALFILDGVMFVEAVQTYQHDRQTYQHDRQIEQQTIIDQ